MNCKIIQVEPEDPYSPGIIVYQGYIIKKIIHYLLNKIGSYENNDVKFQKARDKNYYFDFYFFDVEN